jgi:hypothetical protein
MGQGDRRHEITPVYYVMALQAVGRGQPASAVLRGARQEIEQRGWRPRTPDDDLAVVPALGVDIRDAIMLAAGQPVAMPMRLGEGLLWLEPIESVLNGATIGHWEQQPDLTTADVLAVIDEAILFAEEAEQRPPANLLAALEHVELAQRKRPS